MLFSELNLLCEEQHSLDWYRARLGKFTGSQIGLLFQRNRKGDGFGETALSYIYQIAAERNLNPHIIEDDQLFSEYLQRTNFETSAMKWGTAMEADARDIYCAKFNKYVKEVGSVLHPTIPNFADSPDGLAVNESNDVIVNSVEIKSPANMGIYIKYASEIKCGADLKKVNKQYYYQCQSHMMCSDTAFCDFIAYMPYIRKPLRVVRVYADLEAFEAIPQLIAEAEEVISNIEFLSDGK